MFQKVTIAPLAFCHTYDLKRSKEAFEKLARKESPSFSCCSASFFRDPLIYGWVEMRYLRLGWSGGCIDQYKMGMLLQDENRQRAITTFKLDNIADDITAKDFFLKILQTYFPSSTLEEISEAWSAAISVSADEKERFEKLVNEATPDMPVFLTANTNELDIEKLLQKLLGEESSRIRSRSEDSNDIIQIKPNVFLCPSYRIGNYGTMQYVINNKSKENSDNIQIIIPPGQEKLKTMLQKDCKVSENNFVELEKYFIKYQAPITDSKLKMN